MTQIAYHHFMTQKNNNKWFPYICVYQLQWRTSHLTSLEIAEMSVILYLSDLQDQSALERGPSHRAGTHSS